MKVDVIMPKMGESLQEGTIIRWLKKPGDKVERDETVLEISTDKVDTEVPSPASGIITRLLAEENETVEVGKVIAEIETEASAAVIAEETKPAPAPVAAPPPAPALPKESEITSPASVQMETPSSGDQADVIMPKMGESLQEGTITKWLKKPGDKVERDEMILEISTDKVDTEVPSPVAGVLVQIIVQENETVEVGKVIARISTKGDAQPVQTAAAPVQQVAEPLASIPQAEADLPKVSSGKRFYSPLVRTIAKEHNISLEELDTIPGTGLEGRVNKTDILAHIERKKSSTGMPVPVPQDQQAALQPTAIKAQEAPSVAPRQPAPAPVQVPSPVSFGEDIEIIPMDRVRQRISEHMVYSKHTSAHVTSVAEADVTALVKFRDKFKDEFFRSEGIKLTFTPFFAKATVEGIKANPMVNVSVDGTNIVRHRRINLGMATALPDGNLIVPVIKNADSLSITGLQRAVTDLANKARTKKLNPDDIMGGTFTITNYGTAGTLFGSPIINQPQCAILGLGAIQKRPVVREINGEHLIVIRDMIYLSITYDHRVIDGQLAGTFLMSMIKALENMNESTITF